MKDATKYALVLCSLFIAVILNACEKSDSKSIKQNSINSQKTPEASKVRSSLPSVLPNGRVPYEAESVCRETCGQSKVELSVRDFVLEPLERITTSYPADYLKIDNDDSEITNDLEYEHNRLTDQKRAMAGVNDYIGNPPEINAVFYLERIGDENTNTWNILQGEKDILRTKLETGAQITDAVGKRVLSTMVALGIIKVIEGEKNNADVIKILKPEFEFIFKNGAENHLEIKIPLYDLKPVPDQALIYFPRNILDCPNTFYVQEMAPKSDFAKQLAAANLRGSKIYGRFSACIHNYEWNGEMLGHPTLEDISSMKIGR